MARAKKTATKRQRPRKSLSAAKLDAMIAEATVDAHDEQEQAIGLYTALEDNLAVPFNTEVLGIEVVVNRIEMTDEEQIVAVCSKGRSRQRISILDLPLPAPLPEGAEWIEALRRWMRGAPWS